MIRNLFAGDSLNAWCPNKSGGLLGSLAMTSGFALVSLTLGVGVALLNGAIGIADGWTVGWDETDCELWSDEVISFGWLAALAFRANQTRVLTIGDKKASTAKPYAHQGTNCSDREIELTFSGCFWGDRLGSLTLWATGISFWVLYAQLI